MLTDGAWMPVQKTAKNDKGEVAYLVGDKWLTDTPQPTETQAPQATQTTQASEPSILDRAKRVAGLGIRAAGPVGAGALAGAAMGAPIGGVGAIPGALAGAGAMSVAQLYDRMSGNNVTDRLMDKMGVPRPETGVEKFAVDVTGGMADAAGVIGAGRTMANSASPVVRGIGETLATNPALQINASAGGAGASSVARENGVGTTGQVVAGLAGGLAVPVAGRLARSIYEVPRDVANTIMAANGSDASAKALAVEAVRRITGDQADDLAKVAATGGTKYVEGTKPTIAEVIAERNMNSPDKIGGSVLRLQKDMTGAVGVEDFFQSIEKKNLALTDAAKKQLNKLYGPKMDAALGITVGNEGGRKVPVDGIKEAIGKILANPKYEGLKVIEDSLVDSIKQIDDMAKETGSVNAKALQNLRGQIGTTIGKYSKANQSFDKRLNAGVEREVQLAIDDAIEASGGAGWKDLMKGYAQSAQNIGKQKERLIESKKQAVGVRSQVSPGNIAASDVARPPTLLNRTMMLTNFIMKNLAENANTPVAKETAKLLADPAEFAKALDGPISNPISKQAREWANKAVMGAMAAEREPEQSQ